MKRLSLATSLLYQISKRLLSPWFVQWFVLFFIEVPKLQSKKLFYSLSGTNPFFVRCPGYRNHTSFPSTITFSILNPISQAVHLPSFINLCFNYVHFHFQSIHFPQLCHFTCIRSEIYLHQTCFASNSPLPSFYSAVRIISNNCWLYSFHTRKGKLLVIKRDFSTNHQMHSTSLAAFRGVHFLLYLLP